METSRRAQEGESACASSSACVHGLCAALARSGTTGGVAVCGLWKLRHTHAQHIAAAAAAHELEFDSAHMMRNPHGCAAVLRESVYGSLRGCARVRVMNVRRVCESKDMFFSVGARRTQEIAAHYYSRSFGNSVVQFTW